MKTNVNVLWQESIVLLNSSLAASLESQVKEKKFSLTDSISELQNKTKTFFFFWLRSGSSFWKSSLLQEQTQAQHLETQLQNYNRLSVGFKNSKIHSF